jgi:hypothetical protein
MILRILSKSIFYARIKIRMISLLGWASFRVDLIYWGEIFNRCQEVKA